MMLDANVVACSATSVYRVLSQAGVLRNQNIKKSLKGTGFQQPLTAHEHWHLNIAYLNICGTFYYIASWRCPIGVSFPHQAQQSHREEISLE